MSSEAEQAAQALEGVGDALDHPLSPAQLEEVGHFALTLVLLRTKAGLDADRKPFVQYTAPYAENRGKAGLQASPVDLARTGAMLGSFLPEVVGTEEVRVHSMSEHEAVKAAAHDQGVDKAVSVRTRAPRAGSIYTGERPRTHARRQHLEQRNFLDVRHPDDMQALGESIGGHVVVTVTKHLEKK